ncbi:interleukin-17C-like [Scleropages formosus]|uniref:Interleukin-17C-like n=1 Tax=Scleropages formosus TaxID=113540 RepID=A0A0P7X978_SCLFO|nr:interleukin-17C-like [Scleropages formosus]
MTVLYVCVLLALSLRGLARRLRHKECFDEDEMKARVDRFLRNHTAGQLGGHMKGHMEGHVEGQLCSSFQLQASSPHHSNRSISPWRYRYPKSVAVAVCLCEGCIINGTEDTSYNSVPVRQVRRVLRRVRCPLNSTRYSLKTSLMEVPVACTCVIPKQ